MAVIKFFTIFMLFIFSSSNALACRPNNKQVKNNLIEIAKESLLVNDISEYELDPNSIGLKSRYLVSDSGIDCPDYHEISFILKLDDEQTDKLNCHRKVFATDGILGKKGLVSKKICRPIVEL